jgi:glycine/serine hydroxymethyltransferase
MNIDNEIRELKEKLDRLENVKKEMERTKNKNISIEDNLTVIHNIIQNKKLSIMKNKYSKVVPLSSYYDSELVAHLEATYNILRELNIAIKNK